METRPTPTELRTHEKILVSASLLLYIYVLQRSLCEAKLKKLLNFSDPPKFNLSDSHPDTVPPPPPPPSPLPKNVK